MTDPNMEKDLLHIIIAMVIKVHGKDGTLALTNYQQVMDGMADKSVIYTEVFGDDLILHCEPLSEKIVTLRDVLEMEAKDGELN